MNEGGSKKEFAPQYSPQIDAPTHSQHQRKTVDNSYSSFFLLSSLYLAYFSI